MFTALHNFCAVDLSAFYFDIRKDRLYCDGADDSARRATRTVLDRTFDCLARWLAPILCFTAEEAWLARHGDAGRPQRPSRAVRRGAGEWLDPELAARWAELRDLRRVVTGALEVERAAKRIGSSLQAAVEITVPAAAAAAAARASISPSCASPRPARCGPASRPTDAFTLPDVPGIGAVVTPAAGRAMRALLAGIAGGRPCRRSRRSVPPLRRGARPRRGARYGRSGVRSWAVNSAASGKPDLGRVRAATQAIA